jgi:TolA-binding protein
MRKLLLISFVFCGCMTDRIEKIENSLFQIQTGMLKVKDELNITNKDFTKVSTHSQRQVAGMTTTLGETHSVIQSLRGDINQIRAELGTPYDRVEQKYSLKSRLDILSAKIMNLIEVQRSLMSSVEEIATAISRKKSRTKSRKHLKNLATVKKAFEKKQYSYIVADITKVIKKSNKPETYELKFLYAESLFKLGKIREAALAFNDISENNNYKKFFPKVNLRLGDCFRLLGDNKVALLYYESLIKTYPNSQEAVYAKKVREKL